MYRYLTCCPFRLLAALWLGFACLLQTQAQNHAQEDGKEMILRHVRKMNAFGFPTGNQVYYLHSTTTLEPKEQTHLAVSPKEVEVKLTITNQRIFYQSTYMEVYQDAREIYTVIHPQKNIVCTRKNPAQTVSSQTQDMVQNLARIQEDLVQLTTVRKCEPATWQGKPIRIIELHTTAAGQKKYHIQKLTYYYDPVREIVLKQWIDYTPDHSTLRQQVATYHTLNVRYKGKIPPDARSCIFKTGTHLRDSYQGYTIEYQN